MKAINRIIDTARRAPMRIVLCESEDERMLTAAARATREGIARIVFVGDIGKTQRAADAARVDLSGMELIDPATSGMTDAFAETWQNMRAKKGMTRAQAVEEMRSPLGFANMMVRLGHADGSVAGAVNTTADVVRMAIQIIGVQPSFQLVSSFFLMMLCEPFHTMKGGLIFSDCALVVDPDAAQLAQIALAAADSASALLMEPPRVAMLSFSSSGSAKHA